MGNVVLDLEKSKYTVAKDGLIFYFSSLFNQNRFFNRIDDYIINETLKLNNKYDVKCNYTLILLLAYYKKIEKRGFKVEFSDGERLSENDLIFCTQVNYKEG